MSYTPRTTQPSNNDLRWRSTAYGGYNNFPSVYDRWGSVTPYRGSVLANCTGYCQGRWMELGNTNTPYGLYSNAKEWLNDAKASGYSIGTEPQLGAIVVFDGWSKTPAGHVGIVEEISSDGSYIQCSESNWTTDITRGYFEYPVTRYRSTGWKRSGSTSGASIGFIYHPGISPTTHTLTVVNGKGSTSGSSGDTVNISATKKQGQIFQGWTLEGSGSIANKNYLNTTFTFGDGNATATANFKDKGKFNWVIYTGYMPNKPRM